MQQLRYFIAVLDHGGFTRAAAHLGRTQQAVSKALGLLEDELGVRRMGARRQRRRCRCRVA